MSFSVRTRTMWGSATIKGFAYAHAMATKKRSGQRDLCPHVDTQWTQDDKGNWHRSHAPARHTNCMAARSYGTGASYFAMWGKKPSTKKAAPASVYTHTVVPTYAEGRLLPMRKWDRVAISKEPEVDGAAG